MFRFFVRLSILMAVITSAASADLPGGLHLPPGFAIRVFAEGLEHPRFMAYSPNGDLFVSSPNGGRIYVLPDRDGKGVADKIETFRAGLDYPHGLAFRDRYLYVAETGKVLRIPYKEGSLDPTGQPEVVVPSIPPGGTHRTRTLGFGPDGRMYVSIGSSCDSCVEKDERRATIMRFNADGSDGKVYARGLRNAVGFVWRPGSDDMWATCNGRDNMGDDIPPDAVDHVVEGGHYGWPFIHGIGLPDPINHNPEVEKTFIPPTVPIQAHSAPLGLRFYNGTQFPMEYRGNLFVCYHGSWNRSVPTGYKVVRIPFKDGKPTGPPVDFLTGFLRSRFDYKGRPVDCIVAPDGSLMVSDDTRGRIFRITWEGHE